MVPRQKGKEDRPGREIHRALGVPDEAAGEVGPGQVSSLPQRSQSVLPQWDRNLHLTRDPHSRLTCN